MVNGNSLGLADIGINDMARIINEGLDNLNKGLSQPIMFLGSPGVGKSSIIEYLASNNWSLLIDLRLSSCDSTDIGGIPIVSINDMGNQVKQNVQSGSLPFEGVFYLGAYKNVILLLDEANLASPDVMKTMYSLLQERRVNEHRLLPECMIVLAGNRADDGIQVEDFGSALNNRIQAYNVVTSAKSWRKSMKEYSRSYHEGNIRIQLMSMFVNAEAPYTNLFSQTNIDLWEKEWKAYVDDCIRAEVENIRKSDDLKALETFGEKEIEEITKKALAQKTVTKPEKIVDFYLPFMLRRLNVTWGDQINDERVLENAYREWLLMAAVDKDGNSLGNGALKPTKQFAVMSPEEKSRWKELLTNINILTQKGESVSDITNSDEYVTLRHKNSVVKMFENYLTYFRKQAVRYHYSAVINAFINNMTDEYLCSLGSKHHDSAHTQFGSPRSWTNLFDALESDANKARIFSIIKDKDADNSSQEYSEIQDLARAIVGVIGANKLMQHLSVFKNFKSLEEICATPKAVLLTPDQMNNKEDKYNYGFYLHTMLSMLKPTQKKEAEALLSQLTLKEYGSLANSELAMYFMLTLKTKFPTLLISKSSDNKTTIQSYLTSLTSSLL